MHQLLRHVASRAAMAATSSTVARSRSVRATTLIPQRVRVTLPVHRFSSVSQGDLEASLESAHALARRGHFRDAAAAFATIVHRTQGVADASTRVRAREARGICLASLGDVPGAIRELRDALGDGLGGDTFGPLLDALEKVGPGTANLTSEALASLEVDHEDELQGAAREATLWVEDQQEAFRALPEQQGKPATLAPLILQRITLLRGLANVLKAAAATKPGYGELAQRHGRAALKLAEKTNQTNLLPVLALEVGECVLHTGDQALRSIALQYFDRASQAAAAANDAALQVRAEVLAATVLQQLGRYSESTSRAQRALSVLRQGLKKAAKEAKSGGGASAGGDAGGVHLTAHSDARLEFSIYQLLATNFAAQKEHEDAAEMFRKSLAASERMRVPGASPMVIQAADACRAQAVRGVSGALRAAGKLDEARDFLRDANAHQESMNANNAKTSDSFFDDSPASSSAKTASGTARPGILDDVEAAMEQGIRQIFENDCAAAKKTLSQALEICMDDPERTQAHLAIEALLRAELGRSLIFEGEFDDAKTNLHKALKYQRAVYSDSASPEAMTEAGLQLLRTVGLLNMTYKGMGRKQESMVYTAMSMALVQQLQENGVAPEKLENLAVGGNPFGDGNAIIDA